jgi:N-acetylglutamate synthase-like GNAT family acetyltransferase
MTSRLLPPAEWPKLAGTYLEPLWPLLKPESCSVIVVEEDGAIIGTWALMSVFHVEGFSAKNGLVIRKLLKAMKVEAEKQGITTVVTASTSPVIADFLTRMDPHTVPIEGTGYVWTLPTV